MLPSVWNTDTPRAESDAVVMLALAAVNGSDEQKRADARDAFQSLYNHGLRIREYRRLRQEIITGPRDVEDWIAWRCMEVFLDELGGDVSGVTVTTVRGRPVILAICKGCTLVFDAQRRDATHCPACSHRPPMPMYDALPALKAGKPARVSLPVHNEHLPSLVERRSTKTMRTCCECGEVMFRNTGTDICSARCKGRKRRRERV